MKPIVLDLCGGTGAWSKPWKDSREYDVRVITLPEHDVRTYHPPENVYGILAAPPCTAFSFAACYLWRQKDETGETEEAVSIVRACLKIIIKCKPKFWALENPAPPRCRIQRCVWELGKPRLIFDPCDYGDLYKKKTAIWGSFIRPPKWFTMRKGKPGYIESISGGQKWKRSITPPGFAKAFFESNRINNPDCLAYPGSL